MKNSLVLVCMGIALAAANVVGLLQAPSAGYRRRATRGLAATAQIW